MTLLASSGSLEGIRKAISDFYMGSTVTLDPMGKEWKVSTGKGPCSNVRVSKKRGRFRFEMEDST